MRLLIVYAHPAAECFNRAVLRLTCETLAAHGHETHVLDLHAEGFDPVLTPERYARYNDTAHNTDEPEIAAHAGHLAWAEGLILVYPTWWYGLPAILKGWLERVLVPGVALRVNERGKPIGPALGHIRVFGAVSTYGAPWWWTRYVGDPGRRTLMRGVKSLCFPRSRTFWSAHYDIHNSTDRSRARALARIQSRMARL